MRVSDFDFDLPEALIAKQPLAERHDSRLLEMRPDGALLDRAIRDLTALVQPGDLWVINDTRVIPARLNGYKAAGGGRVEVLLLEPAGEDHCWHAWSKSNRPLKAGAGIIFSDSFRAEVCSRSGKDIVVRLIADDVAAAIEACGHMPLPPYIDRPDSEADRARYQTVFANQDGAVAAPTAGLHFSAELMAAMEDAGARFAPLTLHVGPGTFQPVQVEDVGDHVMHEERYLVPDQTATMVNAAKQAGSRVIAVGTTSLRTLEAAGQSGRLQCGAGRTDIFITPGYHFRIVDALLTNFHLPRSTLIMLVAALAGRKQVLAAYEHAKAAGYRFYSYGDAMFVPRLEDM